MKGSISLTTMLVGSATTVLVALIGAWGTAWAGSNNAVSDIKTEVAVQENRISSVEDGISDIKNDNKILNSKMDALLWERGINPDKIK
jgi:hypothetical protein